MVLCGAEFCKILYQIERFDIIMIKLKAYFENPVFLVHPKETSQHYKIFNPFTGLFGVTKHCDCFDRTPRLFKVIIFLDHFPASIQL